jgi:hypothetical protein
MEPASRRFKRRLFRRDQQLVPIIVEAIWLYLRRAV